MVEARGGRVALRVHLDPHVALPAEGRPQHLRAHRACHHVSGCMHTYRTSSNNRVHVMRRYENLKHRKL